MSQQIDRRTFITALGGAVAATATRPAWAAADASVPAYLKDHAELYARDPHGAALAWFRDAKFGLFMHYGLYSILGRGEWVMYHEQIPVAEYERLKDRFRPDQFDADFITDLAAAAGMRYVNLTARHHDSFCLFDSRHSDYTSRNSPAKRDLVGELAEQCRKKGLGLFLYYSYALDWRHPDFYPREFNPIARPAYQQPEPRYLWTKDEDFAHYLQFVHGQIQELLTNYGPLAGIWFDPIMGYYARPDLFPIAETYAMIRRLQPQTLLCFKQGANGTEDFAAPERTGQSLAERVRKQYGDAKAQIAADAWAANQSKHNEICDTLQPHVWGYKQADDDQHLDAEETLRRLGQAFGQNCNLLMNTGPLPDGSIHPVDVQTLREVGRRIRADGWPAPRAPEPPKERPKAKKVKPGGKA
jgi:alpha-L-fucosidase